MVIVTHDSRGAIEETLAALTRELRDDDELIVVDNASADGTPETVEGMAPDATLVESGANVGFASGCNAGAELASGDLLLLLNPDAVPQQGFRDAIERPLVDGCGWDAWMGLVTAEEGRVVSARAGVVHFTAIAWAAGTGEPLGDPPREEVGFASGACLAIPLAKWREAGGLPGEFFLYQEDVDLSLRLRLAGGRIGIEPAACVDHDHEFEKGVEKWRYLERNRWAVLIRLYPAPLLALLAPALLATEVALVPLSVAQGWGWQKVLAWRDVAARLPQLLRERREIQTRRRIGSGEFARYLVPDLDSPYLGRASRSRLLRAALRAYWSLVSALLGARA